MSTDKRARQKENRAHRVAAAEAAAAKARMRSRVMTYGGLALVIVVAIVGAAILLSDDDPEPTDTGAVVDGPDTGSDLALTGGGLDTCPESAEPVTEFAAPPELCIDTSATYTAVVDTTAGPFTIELDATRAPNTVNNFVVLARHHYYDGVSFHRVIQDFVIQGGDPVGNPPGTGGPGYRFADELPAAGEYQVGSVAMANSGADTNGSQFFVVTGENGAGLPPLYSLFGTVTDGLDVVAAIGTTETDANDQPVEDILINSVTITES